jgi:hypothetical protein
MRNTTYGCNSTTESLTECLWLVAEPGYHTNRTLSRHWQFGYCERRHFGSQCVMWVWVRHRDCIQSPVFLISKAITKIISDSDGSTWNHKFSFAQMLNGFCNSVSFLTKVQLPSIEDMTAMSSVKWLEIPAALPWSPESSWPSSWDCSRRRCYSGIRICHYGGLILLSIRIIPHSFPLEDSVLSKTITWLDPATFYSDAGQKVD